MPCMYTPTVVQQMSFRATVTGRAMGEFGNGGKYPTLTTRMSPYFSRESCHHNEAIIWRSSEPIAGGCIDHALCDVTATADIQPQGCFMYKFLPALASDISHRCTVIS